MLRSTHVDLYLRRDIHTGHRDRPARGESVGQHHCRSLQGAHGLLRAFPAGAERAARLLDQHRLRLRGELAGGRVLTSEIT